VDVKDATIDVQLPYLCRLPSGRSITIFFYNGSISNDIAFGGILENGVNFAYRLMQQFPKRSRAASRLVHVANDGETYGHHHAFGNMALAYMFYYIETNNLAKVTIYGEFLSENPPEWEVKIIDDTSWSCFHGVERWRANCGCHLDFEKERKQEWRKYLRKTLDWLRDNLIPLYERSMAVYFKDPWKIRNDYINVLFDPTEENKSKTLWAQSSHGIPPGDREKIIDLLEMQRCAMYMYTSCGWFFDDISGIESVQILRYAARAMELARKISGNDLENEFLNRLAFAKSNIPELKDGKRIYNTFIKSAMIAAAKKNNV
jgi:alpha-amylase/alpha-mannosidase (GH57 family)